MRTKLLAWLILPLFSNSISAQTKTGNDVRQFTYLEGVWKGKGRVLNNDGANEYFNETETAVVKLGGAVILVEAFGVSISDRSKVINDALGILRFDGDREKTILEIFQPDGSVSIADVKALDTRTLEWSLKISTTSYIKYIIKIDGNRWHETGFSSNDGIVWNTIFEMILTKQ